MVTRAASPQRTASGESRRPLKNGSDALVYQLWIDLRKTSVWAHISIQLLLVFGLQYVYGEDTQDERHKKQS
ncbi:hypothetical protein CEXT_505731 [Caerostris extrusa]|uniref:Uncharacterized protein n=1 Tax=Caerostris extrusa TaxID=172846 RepID=A0AAV4MJZ2_CAEEX|nr:hypothetical protein CEXT_505731 [Caerostris extrusa]